MRVIAGKHKGRKLKSPETNDVRPTTDKIKGAIFNVLQFNDVDAVVLDLFAGAGGVGIEFLSRGAKKCYFNDKSRKSLKIVKENIELCREIENAEILNMDYMRVLEMMTSKNIKLDYIFADAPYELECSNQIIEYVANHDILNENGKLIIECEKNEKVIENTYDNVIEYKEKIYGITKVIFVYFK